MRSIISRTVLSNEESLSVAFRSAKVAFWGPFAERKATVILRTFLSLDVLR